VSRHIVHVTKDGDGWLITAAVSQVQVRASSAFEVEPVARMAIATALGTDDLETIALDVVSTGQSRMFRGTVLPEGD
jgi:hypothetical protein